MWNADFQPRALTARLSPNPPRWFCLLPPGVPPCNKIRSGKCGGVAPSGQGDMPNYVPMSHLTAKPQEGGRQTLAYMSPQLTQEQVTFPCKSSPDHV